MNLRLLTLIGILSVVSCTQEGFFMRMLSREPPISNNDIAETDDNVDICESIKIMPRVAWGIVGGSTLEVNISAPYAAAIGERLRNGSIEWFCGGSLISRKSVLTAAHCLTSRRPSVVRLGSFSIKERRLVNDYEVSRKITHPSYNITEPYNDIAIVETKNKIVFSKTVKPVCLPKDDQNTYVQEIAKVIGWGAEEYGGQGTVKLKQVEVKVYNNSDCEKAYRKSRRASAIIPRGINSTQLCAGSSSGGKDSCQGDSGGPLVFMGDDGIVRQIGIVNMGLLCGSKKYPGVYTRVSSYLDWIKKNSKESKRETRKIYPKEVRIPERPEQASKLERSGETLRNSH